MIGIVQRGLPENGDRRTWLAWSSDGRTWLMRWHDQSKTWGLVGFHHWGKEITSYDYGAAQVEMKLLDNPSDLEFITHVALLS